MFPIRILCNREEKKLSINRCSQQRMLASVVKLHGIIQFRVGSHRLDARLLRVAELSTSGTVRILSVSVSAEYFGQEIYLDKGKSQWRRKVFVRGLQKSEI